MREVSGSIPDVSRFIFSRLDSVSIDKHDDIWADILRDDIYIAQFFLQPHERVADFRRVQRDYTLLCEVVDIESAITTGPSMEC
jgi:hypothetical protein